MAARREPTLRSRWLGRELRRLREPRKITDVGRHLDRDPSGVSRFENGGYALPQEEVVAMLDLYEVTDGVLRQTLVELNEEEWRTDWWDAYVDDVDGSFLDAIWLESKAQRIRAFDLAFVNGLLQTPDYIRALARAVRPDGGGDRAVDRLVELRLGRQNILERVTPPDVSLVVDESALRRAVGGPPVLAQQVRRLAEATTRPNVEVRVLTLAHGAHPAPDCGFRMLELPEPLPDVAQVDRPYGMVVAEAPAAEQFEPVYADLVSAALDSETSVEFLNDIAAQLEEP